jgi:protocatechuate 3,4-dioxygenase beta subunit
MESMKLFIPLLLAAIASAQSVEGTAVNRTTGSPIAGVAVTLLSGNSEAYKATTDAQGAFRIDTVKPGVYTPHLEMHGFIPAAASLRTFQVLEGGQPVTLRAEMVPMGKLSGRVLDSDGKPVRGAIVEVLASFGGPMAPTNANGEFVFDELVPATYMLAARPPKGAKALEVEGGRRVGSIMTFFPGVPQRGAASRITIAPGAEIWGQDIRLIAAPVHRILGVALDPKGDPIPGVDIQLADPTRLTAETDAQAHSADDGTFEFRDIGSGDWRISATANRDGAALKAFQSVQLGDRDIERFELRLGLPFSVQGTLELQNADGSATLVKNALINLAPSVGGSGYATGRPDESGKFTADGVYPGVYQVVPIQPSPQFYLASIRLGDRESVDGRVEFYSGGLPLSVVYRSDGGTVRGTVEECGAATVVLIPQNLTLRRRPYVRNAKCKANGGYEFTAVRPGEYYVLALNPSDPAFNLLSTDVDQGKLNAAAKATVRPNESTLADLQVMR